MGNHHARDKDVLPEIIVHHSKNTLFQFENQRLRASLGDERQHIEQREVPAHQVLVRKAKPGVPRVSPMAFYQGIAGPPSARAKGKHRAVFSPNNGNARVVEEPPRSPLYPRTDAYTRQRYLTDRSAGPSRETYM
jgi:hypothetical protein